MIGTFIGEKHEGDGRHIYYSLFVGEPSSEECALALKIAADLVCSNFGATRIREEDGVVTLRVLGGEIQLHLDDGLGAVYMDTQNPELLPILERISARLRGCRIAQI